MPIRDRAAMTKSLDNDYGVTRGPNAESYHLLALFINDPMIALIDGGGYEVSGGGYARVQVDPVDWLAAADGYKALVVPMQFPTTTEEWLDSPTHWALFAPDGVTMWDCGPFVEPLEVTGAGAGPKVDVAVFYDDAVSERE